MKISKKNLQDLLERCDVSLKRRSPVPHYLIPGTDLELIDIIKSKMSPDEWKRFCWGSAIQYVYRVLDKGEVVRDCEKAITYLTWLKETE